MNDEVKESRRVSELAFKVVFASAEMEGYTFDGQVSRLNGELLKDLDNETILSFLELEETKVTFFLDKGGAGPVMVAHNKVSNEAIEISGLGDHFMALIKVVAEADRIREVLKEKENVKILSNDFIKDVNRQLLYIQQDEVAIGEYRDVDFLGRPLEVHHSMRGDNGEYKPCISANIETSVNQNVIKKMDELVDWVNNVAFKPDRDFMLDIAEFHSRFVQIQPFRDGNKRTARLLTNYLMLLFNKSFIDINEDNREEYLANIYYSTAETEEIFKSESSYFKTVYDKIFANQGARTNENKYVPLKEFFLRNLIKEKSKKIIKDILRYDNRKEYHANEIDSITLTV